MKKYFFFIAILLGGIFTSCNDDIDDKMKGLDDAEKPGNTREYNWTVQDADISKIVTALRANNNKQDSIIANEINTTKVFSETAKPNDLIPYLLTNLYYSVDVGASAKVTYKYDNGRDEITSGLTTSSANSAYILGNNDYKTVWGEPFATALTPAKSPAVQLPKLLAANFPNAESGTYKVVSYYYSEEEPVPSSVVGDIFYEEGFDNNPSGTGSGKKMDIAGWTNTDITGGTSIYWQCRTYSNNNYAQVSSYQSGALNDVWMISPQVDLANAASPRFSFDIVAGNYNATCLKVFVSDNFDGNQANILAATWTDVTSNFTLPTPATGYSTWASAGSASLSTYKGKKVYIALRYEGDDLNTSKKTTTYQIDNFKVYDEELGLEVESKEAQYAAYLNTNGNWAPASSDVIVLQPKDYTYMNITNGIIATADASHYLPIYLASNYSYAKKDDIKYIVYKTGSTSFYTDRLICVDAGTWQLDSFIEEKTDQFVFALVDEENNIKKWIFDPTFVVTMVKGKNPTDDYMMMVNYVAEHEALDNPKLISSYGDSEYYYGFSGNYGNITYRDKDRAYDTSYPSTGTREEKLAFMNKRTIEGMAIYLTLKFPDATPLINGVVQEAKVTALIYDLDATKTNLDWTYRFRCIGDKEWQFIERVDADGNIEKAEEE